MMSHDRSPICMKRPKTQLRRTEDHCQSQWHLVCQTAHIQIKVSFVFILLDNTDFCACEWRSATVCLDKVAYFTHKETQKSRSHNLFGSELSQRNTLIKMKILALKFFQQSKACDICELSWRRRLEWWSSWLWNEKQFSFRHWLVIRNGQLVMCSSPKC